MNNGNQIVLTDNGVIFADKNKEGAWRISQMVGQGVGEYLLTRVYYFTPKREAIRLFKQEVKELN